MDGRHQRHERRLGHRGGRGRHRNRVARGDQPRSERGGAVDRRPGGRAPDSSERGRPQLGAGGGVGRPRDVARVGCCAAEYRRGVGLECHDRSRAERGARRAGGRARGDVVTKGCVNPGAHLDRGGGDRRVTGARGWGSRRGDASRGTGAVRGLGPPTRRRTARSRRKWTARPSRRGSGRRRSTQLGWRARPRAATRSQWTG